MKACQAHHQDREAPKWFLETKNLLGFMVIGWGFVFFLGMVCCLVCCSDVLFGLVCLWFCFVLCCAGLCSAVKMCHMFCSLCLFCPFCVFCVVFLCPLSPPFPPAPPSSLSSRQDARNTLFVFTGKPTPLQNQLGPQTSSSASASRLHLPPKPSACQVKSCTSRPPHSVC